MAKHNMLPVLLALGASSFISHRAAQEVRQQERQESEPISKKVKRYLPVAVGGLVFYLSDLDDVNKALVFLSTGQRYDFSKPDITLWIPGIGAVSKPICNLLVRSGLAYTSYNLMKILLAKGDDKPPLPQTPMIMLVPIDYPTSDSDDEFF